MHKALKMPNNQNNRNDTMVRKSNEKKKKGFLPNKKRSGHTPNDDDSIDSKGNIRNLIAYDDSDFDQEDSDDSSYNQEDKSNSTKRSAIAHRTRTKQSTKQKKENSLVKTKQSKTIESDIEEEEFKSSNKLNKLCKKLKSEKELLQSMLREKKSFPPIQSKSSKSSKKSRRVIESEEDEDDEDDEDDESEPPGIIFSFETDEAAERMIPKRHNMKKESAEVKKFVKLITTPSDEDTIDGQIDQFKALAEDQRTKLLSVLESRNKTPGTGDVQQGLMFKILTMNLPAATQSMVLSKYNSLQSLDPGSGEYFKLRNWLEKLTSMPLGMYKEIPIKISDGSDVCGAFMAKARKCLDDAIYGQDEAKLQILQFIGTKIANPTGSGLSLLLAGPPGIGKTSLIKNGVAKALQWPFQFISLGGDSDASTYTGHQLVYESSHCGKIVNSLCAAKSMSMVLMFDELDKISTTAKGEEVQNLLVHLTDPVQNGEFEDKYLSGIPIDLSRVMFTFSANYLEKIDKVLLDRMIVVNLQGYNLKEKAAIAENYLLPAALKEVDLAEKVGLTKEVVTYMIETYANEETGVRELKRCIEQVVQKINMLRMFNTKDLPFYIKDFSLPFVVKKEHIDLFLKKKLKDTSALHMYT
jgi:ATP-dependent Lon protease